MSDHVSPHTNLPLKAEPDDTTPSQIDVLDDSSPKDMAGDTPAGRNFFHWFFLGVLIFSLYLLYTVMRPFLHTLILACVLTGLCYPSYKKCLKATQRPLLASLIVLVGFTFLIVLPISLFIIGLIPQAAKSIGAVNEWLADNHLSDIMTQHINPLLLSLQETFPELDLASLNLKESIVQASRNTGQFLLGTGTYILSNTLMFIMHFGLILLTMFFLLIDGGNLVRRVEYFFPLKPAQTSILIDGMRRMSRAVLIGGFAVAALQGVAGGIGFAIVGIPPFFWGTVMMFAALVPVVGTGLVWVPAALVLFLRGEMGSALFLTLWCGIGVTSIDSFLRPLLVRGGADVPVLFIFLSILGGINVFGMLGLLYGPMILGFVAIMLQIYNEEYHSLLHNRTSHMPQEEKEE